MKVQRIEIDANLGHFTITRTHLGHAIRIDSIIRDPKPYTDAWRYWEIAADASDDKLRDIATKVQERCDGEIGDDDRINEFYRELERFQEKD